MDLLEVVGCKNLHKRGGSGREGSEDSEGRVISCIRKEFKAMGVYSGS